MEYKFTATDFNNLLNKELGGVLTEASDLAGIDLWNWEGEPKLTFHQFMKSSIHKKDIALCLASAMKVLVTCRNLLSEGTSKLEEMKDEHIEFQKEIIEQQNELIKCKTEQLNAIQSTVKSELKSYSDAVQSSCSSSSGNVITQEQVKNAVKSVVHEEDRSRNVMIFGIKEQTDEKLQTVVSDVFENIGEKPRVAECYRVGRTKSGSEKPIKVTFRSTDTVQRMLRKSGLLRKSENYKSVFLSADRTLEERIARKELVDQLKQKRKDDPTNQYYLLGDRICCSANKQNTG